MQANVLPFVAPVLVHSQMSSRVDLGPVDQETAKL